MASQTMAAKPQERKVDASTRLLLKGDEVRHVVIAPDGLRVAVSRQEEGGSVVTVNQWPGMKVLRTVKPGNVGAINTVRWLDNDRLVIGTDPKIKIDRTGIEVAFPSVFIVPVAGGKATQMPANFVATIEGDPKHLLVSRCTRMVDGDCVLEVRKVSTEPNAGPGELVSEAPDSHSTLISDERGQVRMALGWGKDGRSRTWLSADGRAWNLLNDESKTGLAVFPMGVAADGKSAFVESQRAEGTDAIERYDFATGVRTEVLRLPDSDPTEQVLADFTQEPIGAWFGHTRPEVRFWNPQHPHAALLVEAQGVLDGKKYELTSVSSDGQRAVLRVSDDRDPGTFQVYDRATRRLALVAKSRPFLEESRLGRSQEVSLVARDGQPLKGILTTPAGSSGKALPMVVMVHGGPYDLADAWGFDPEVQMLALHGFAVLQVNFRGSGGYGKAFVDKGMRQWGKAMQDDVTDATRWAIAGGIADPSRVCIYGASYGAYAAMMGAAREPELYRCAAAFGGVYDLNKMYKWANLRRTDLGLEYLHRALGTDQAELAASSPMQLAGQIKANVFLAHGKLDATCDFRFAKAMQKALNKTRSKDVELVVYDWEEHGLDDPTNREDFYARLLGFLHANLDVAPTMAKEQVGLR